MISPEPPHDDAGRRRVRFPVCAPAEQAIRSLAVDHGVTVDALVDALAHRLTVADAAWLRGVVQEARRIDAESRRRDRRHRPG